MSRAVPKLHVHLVALHHELEGHRAGFAGRLVDEACRLHTAAAAAGWVARSFGMIDSSSWVQPRVPVRLGMLAEGLQTAKSFLAAGAHRAVGVPRLHDEAVCPLDGEAVVELAADQVDEVAG
jgi:hypothetical protein